jgi:hypothetical protein
MPTFMGSNDEIELVERYCNHMQYVDVTPADLDAVRELRREASREIEDVAALQKQLAGAKDYDGAKVTSELAKAHKRQVKACTIILDNWGGEALPEHVPVKFYPVELMAELDRAFGRMPA